MDFQAFRANKTWLTVDFGPAVPLLDADGQPVLDENNRPKMVVDRTDERSVTFRIAYRPQAMTDADAEWIAQWDRARVMDYKGLYDDPPEESEPVELNRAQRRAQEKAENRATSTPAREKIKRPTYAEMLARLICDWDLTYGQDADGNDIPWPVTRENIETIDYALRIEMLTIIMDDYTSRPSLTTLSRRYSAATMGNSPITATSSSEPSDTENSPGNISGIQNGRVARAGISG